VAVAVRITLNKATGERTFEFDTVAEAVQFEAQTQPKGSKQPAAKRKVKPVSGNGGGWPEFCASLAIRKDAAAVRMKKMLALVKGRGADGIGWDELAKAMSVEDVQKVYGTFSGLGKGLRSAGIRPADVITAGKDKKLRPGRLLVEHEPPTP